MTQETTEKAPPTIADLEGKVQRLQAQREEDQKTAREADAQVAKAMKTGDVAQVIGATDARSMLLGNASKTASQLKAAISAVNSAKLAANAGKRADIHDAMRVDKSVVGHFEALEALGAEWFKIERGEGGDLIINSGGAEIKKARAPSSNGGNRGTASWEVNGESFTSRELIEAHLDLLGEKTRAHFDEGNFRAFSMTREAERIHTKLTSGN